MLLVEFVGDWQHFVCVFFSVFVSQFGGRLTLDFIASLIHCAAETRALDGFLCPKLKVTIVWPPFPKLGSVGCRFLALPFPAPLVFMILILIRCEISVEKYQVCVWLSLLPTYAHLLIEINTNVQFYFIANAHTVSLVHRCVYMYIYCV